MSRKLLPPEQATSLEEFNERASREWAYCNNRGPNLRTATAVTSGMLMVIVACVFLGYALSKNGMWWQWLGVFIPIAIVAWLLRRAWRNGRQDGARMRELDRLQAEWQARADRGEIPRTRAEVEGTTS